MENYDESILLQKAVIIELNSGHKGKSERSTILSKLDDAMGMGPVMVEMGPDSKSC